MIVLVGRLEAADVRALAAAIATRGGRCEIVGTAPPDAAGDQLLQRLAAAGVGHAAVLRTPAADLEPADLELALRYLPDARVIVLAGVDDLASVAARAAAFAGAALVVLTGAGATAPELPSDERSIVLAAPVSDPDGAFAGVLAALAVRLDAGEALGSAWQATLDERGAESVSGELPAPGPAAAAGRAQPAAPGPARRGSGRRCGRR